MRTLLHTLTACALLSSGAAFGQCPEGQTEISVVIVQDRYGTETTWTLTGPGGSPVYSSGGPYSTLASNTTVTHPAVNACVPDGALAIFTIYDAYGDGICCAYGEGSYTVTAGGTQVATGGNFTSSEQTIFTVGMTPALDLAVFQLTNAQIIVAGNVSVTGSAYNAGTTAITSFDLSYSVNGGTPVTSTITANVAPGATYNFTHPTQWAASMGSHTLTVSVSNPNGAGEDDNPSNDAMDRQIAVATESVDRTAVLEQFTSSTCPPCAAMNVGFAPTLTGLNTNHEGGRVAAVKYHMNWPSPGNDPSYNPDGNTRRGYYGVSGIPDLYLDGVNTGSTASSAYVTAYNRPAFVALTPTYTIEGNTLNVTTVVDPKFTLAGNFTLHVAVTEDSYAYPASTTSQDEFHYVMRKMYPNGQGTSITQLTAGSPQTFTNSYTFVNGSPAQSNYNLWTNLNNTTVVVFLQNEANMDVLQGGFIPVEAPIGVNENLLDASLSAFPNPANDQLFVRFQNADAGKVRFELHDMTGRLVLTETQAFGTGRQQHGIELANFNQGLYTLSVYTDGARATRTVSVVK